MNKVLIIGAGHAGGSVAALLRQYGHEGPIILAGEEPSPPYQRPPLSKAWLKGETDLDGVLLRPAGFYAENGVELRTGVTATAIDREGRTVAFADGTVEGYDHLILATGSRARTLPLPGADLPQMLSLRTLADAERLKAALGPGRRLVVVGGGYVGLEAAASARALGAEAVVLERAGRVLARVASETLSDAFTARHRAEGVDIRTGVDIVGFEPEGDAALVRLAGGEAVRADLILVGVGAQPCDELAAAAGLACAGGVIVDREARTGDPAVFAIGDVTWRPIPALGETHGRLESVPNALEQAKQAASAITGRPPPPAETPWFWSDQYDMKLQIAGLPGGADRQVVRGDPASGRFAVFHLQGERIVCVEAVSSPADFMAGRLMIGRGTAVDALRLADLSIPVKSLAA